MALGLAGLSAIAIGVLMVLGPDRSEAAAKYTAKLQGSGVLAGHLLAAGAALGGLGLVAFYMRRVAATLLAPGAVEDAMSEVGADLAEFRNKLYELENDHVHFRTEIDAARREVREHREGDRSQEAVDALFRLAGALDTLHARFDQRLGETSQGVEQSLRELGSLVESSRDYLQESLEQSDEHIGGLSVQLVDLAGRFSGEAYQGAGEPVADQIEPPAEPSIEFGEHAPEASDEQPLSLGLLDQFDDALEGEQGGGLVHDHDQSPEQALNALETGDTWEVEMPEAGLDLAPPSTEDTGPTRIQLEAPLPPLPAVPDAEAESMAPTTLDRMEEVVKSDVAARIVEGLDLGSEGPPDDQESFDS
jgi:outer membrane murein-binding lipoprotein Lpp